RRHWTKDSFDSNPSALYPSLSAVFMISTQIGRARVDPYPPWIVRLGVSRPTQTAHVTDDVKPANQASLKSLVVPVLPAQGFVNPSDFTEAAVPRVVTSARILLIDQAGPGLVAR